MPQDSNSVAFLVFEGLDGSGKSTLIQHLAAELKSRGEKFRITREPGGTPLAEDIRKLLLRTDDEVPVATTELLLYAASRAQHVAKVIRPALENGEWVLCDRFSPSAVAFQSFARGLSRQDVDWLNRFAQAGLNQHLTVLLDVSVDESRTRRLGRAANGEADDRMEQESRVFHEAVRQGYLAQAKENPDSWLVVDATQSPENIKSRVIRELKERGWLRS